MACVQYDVAEELEVEEEEDLNLDEGGKGSDEDGEG